MPVVATRAHKKAAVENKNMLLYPDILRRVLSFVGLGQYAFIATVSRGWKQVYASVPRHQADGIDCDGMRKQIKCKPNMTLASAVFASVSRLKLACCYSRLYDKLTRFKFQLKFIAGRSADINVLQELTRYKRNCYSSQSVACGAAEGGSLPKLTWLLSIRAEERPKSYGISTVADYAAGGGHLHILKYLKQQYNCSFGVDTIYNAAGDGHLDVLKYLYNERCPWDPSVCDVAAMQGDLTAVRWLREHGYGWDSAGVTKCAARSGSVPLMQYLRGYRAELTADTMREAAQEGHTELCAYLHSQQCPMDELCCAAAASAGHADTLRWLHSHGCPWQADDRICVDAAAGGAVDALDYLVEQGIVMDDATLTAMLNAAGANSKLATAQWLWLHGAAWPAVLADDSTVWRGAVLVWARAEGCKAPAIATVVYHYAQQSDDDDDDDDTSDDDSDSDNE
jgi:hypothetical protein